MTGRYTVMDSIELPELEWIRQLGAGDVRNARLLHRQRSLLLHISRISHPELTYEIPYGSAALSCSGDVGIVSLVRDSEGQVRRASCDRLGRVLESNWNDIRSFLEKAEWLFKVFQGADFLTAYQPKESERSYELALRDYLRIIFHQRSALSGSSAPKHPEIEEIRVLKGILAEDWREVFGAADRAYGVEKKAFNWADVMVQGLSGNIAFVRESLARPDGLPKGCPSNIFLGGVLQKLELHKEAVNAFKRGLPRFLIKKHGHVCHSIGKSLLRLGEGESAVPWLLRSVRLDPGDVRGVLRNIELLMDAGDFEAALVECKQAFTRCSGDYRIGVMLVRLYLWMGEYSKAREMGSRLVVPEGETALRTLLAGLLVLEGNYEVALPLFEALIQENPGDGENYFWYAEVCLRLERHSELEAALEKARAKDQTAINIVFMEYYRWIQGVIEYGQEFSELLLVLGLDKERAAVGEDRERGLHLLELALERFKGNRTSTLTWLVPGTSLEPEDSVKRLRRLCLDEALPFIGSRTACSDALRKLRSHSFEAVKEELDGLMSRFPKSPHPCFYRGELFLWMGELDRALDDFEQGHLRLKTRWSFVGKAAVYILREENDKALRELKALRESFEPLAAATTYVYQGEMERRRGNFAEAKRLLTEAVDAKPGRLAAWMNLVLIHRQMGEEERGRDIFDRLLRQYPRLFWDALENPEAEWPPHYEDVESLYEQALLMMRGNRSSHLVTYFDRRGRFRVLEDMGFWVDFTRKNAHNIGRALAARLSDLTLGDQPSGTLFSPLTSQVGVKN